MVRPATAASAPGEGGAARGRRGRARRGERERAGRELAPSSQLAPSWAARELGGCWARDSWTGRARRCASAHRARPRTAWGKCGKSRPNTAGQRSPTRTAAHCALCSAREHDARPDLYLNASRHTALLRSSAPRLLIASAGAAAVALRHGGDRECC